MQDRDVVLLIDDERFSREYFRKILESNDCQVHTVATGKQGLKFFKRNFFDLVILDIRLPDIDGMELLKDFKKMNRFVPVIMITGYGSIEKAVRSMKLGAFDFLTKPFDEREKILITVKNAINQGKLERENVSLKSKLETQSMYPNIIGKSRSMQRVFETMRKASEVNSNVIIQGDSGTGKELISRSIHFNSHRKDYPFLAVNCAALPESLLESTLFGYEKGAFTGATSTKIGYFEEASGGTLFLDEISEASASLQAKLLRVLQDNDILRVGGTKYHKVDVRLIAATNKDIHKEVLNRRFRKDLFYRINVIKIDIPPLVERAEDIPLLIGNFMRKYCLQMKKKPKEINPAALQILMEHHWPGNVRELQNFFERIAALHSGDVILESDVIEHLSISEPKETDAFLQLPYEKAKNLFEKRYFSNLLKKCGNNIDNASNIAQIHTATIYRKMKKYNTKR